MTTEKKADITKRELTETLRAIATDGKTGGQSGVSDIRRSG